MSALKSIVICLLPCGLLACSPAVEDDLAQWMRSSDSLIPMQIEPLPSVQVFEPRQYNADHSLHDPFVPRKASVQAAAYQPDLHRPREPLEAYPLEGLKFVGVVSRHNRTYATIQTPDNLVYQVKPGNYLGEHFGLITALAENRQSHRYEMTVKQTVQDLTSGEWTVQMTTLELQENQ